MERINDALSEYNNALKKNPNNGELLERKARALYLLGMDASMSADWATRDEKYASNCARVWETNGDVLNKSASYEDAIEKYNIALEINEVKEIVPGDSTVNPTEIRRKIGMIYYQIGKSQLPPSNEETPEYYDCFKNATKYFEKAAKYFNNLTECNDSDEAAWLMLGQCYHMQWQYNKAIECYKNVINLNDGERLYGKAKLERMPHIRVCNYAIKKFELKRDPLRIVIPCILNLENLADVCGSAEVSITIGEINLDSSRIKVDANSAESDLIYVNIRKEDAIKLVGKTFSLKDIPHGLTDLEPYLETIEKVYKTKLAFNIVNQEVDC
jgi:tetratricopeptide (TPR) repeat protein